MSLLSVPLSGAHWRECCVMMIIGAKHGPRTHTSVSAAVLTCAARRREAQSGYTVPEMRSGGVSVRQLLDGGCLANSEMARVVFKAGYTLFDVHGADAFTADQLLYAGAALCVRLASCALRALTGARLLA